MNTTKMSQEIKIDERGTDKQGRQVSTMEKDLNTMKSALTVSQRTAICFAAGVIGAAAVVNVTFPSFSRRSRRVATRYSEIHGSRSLLQNSWSVRLLTRAAP